MFKQVLILAGSIIAIAAVVATAAGDSTDKAPEPEPKVEEKAAPAPKPVATDESYYDDDENFVFGEPVTYDEDGSSAAVDTPSEYRAATAPQQSGSSTAPLGSVNNPVDLTPKGGKRQ